MRCGFNKIGLALCATALASCAHLQDRETVVTPAEPTAEPTPERVTKAPPTPPPATAATPTRPSPPRTAVVVGGDVPEYERIVAEIVRRGDRPVTVHTLFAQPGDAARVVEEIDSEKAERIIAVGLPAAFAAREVANIPTVFCEVFNYQDHDLLSATSKGVSLLPPFALQLRAWRGLSPNLRHVGVITGPGQDPLVAEMRRAAASFGIELTARVVRSDLEALYEFREIAPTIEGLWLLPDNRILSPDALHEILSYSARHGKQVAAFGDNLLKMGALLSLTADPRDVVDRVLERLEAVDGNGRLLGPDISSLRAVKTRVNDEVAAQLGLATFERAADARLIPLRSER